MDGLFGVTRFGDGRLEPPDIEALDSAARGGTESVVSAHALIAARGWAERLDGGRLCVAGQAHLVNRSELERFPGESALAIATRLYRADGVHGLARLDGQFCIALWDGEAGRLVLAVDRFATRPLYYVERRGGVAFASRLRGLARHERGDVDAQAMLEYLVHSVVPTPRSAFSRVSKVPPGHFLVCERGWVKLVPYWDMTYPERRDGGPADWARRLRQQIEAAVERHVDAEPSIEAMGAFLSGGTDSSTVAGMMRRISGVPVKTFSIGYGEASHDELSYARTSAQWFGTTPHEHRLTSEDALRSVGAIARYYDEPFGNASAIATYACALLAQEHGVRSLFAGDGGDELFAGNEHYRGDQVFELYQKLPAPLRAHITDPLLQSLPRWLPKAERARSYLRRSNIPKPRRFFSYGLLFSEPLGELLAPDFLEAVDTDQLLAAAESHYHNPAPGTSGLNRHLYLDLRITISDNDLRKVGGMTELAGVAVRYPFLDRRLAEFTGEIPPGLKMRGLQKRYIFKRALADFLPPAVLKKRKHGFGVPVAEWMRSDPRWREFVADVIHDQRTRQREYMRPAVLDDLWERHQSESTSFYGDTLWPLVMLELWHREHVDADIGGGR